MNTDLKRRWRSNIDEARQLARETAKAGREIRVPTRRRNDGWRAVLLALAAGAAGAVAMYLLDPIQGKRRRAMLADQSAAAVRDAADRADKARRLAAGRLGGVAQEAFHIGQGSVANDAALAAKVETELFRSPSVPKGTININVEAGRVVLRGEIDTARQRSALERKAKSIAGVLEVENLLHLPGEPVVASAPRGVVASQEIADSPAPNLPD
jgi:hyperosmotically inducible periplasmic protein